MIIVFLKPKQGELGPISEAVLRFLEEKNLERQHEEWAFTCIQQKRAVFLPDLMRSLEFLQGLPAGIAPQGGEDIPRADGIFVVFSYLERLLREEGDDYLRVFALLSKGAGESLQPDLCVSLFKHLRDLPFVMDIFLLGKYPEFDEWELIDIVEDTWGSLHGAEDLADLAGKVHTLAIKRYLDYLNYPGTSPYKISQETEKYFEGVAQSPEETSSNEAQTCEICFQAEGSLSGATLNKCPSCGFNAHPECWAQWTKTGNIGTFYLFRCFRCLTLLKLAPEFIFKVFYGDSPLLKS